MVAAAMAAAAAAAVMQMVVPAGRALLLCAAPPARLLPLPTVWLPPPPAPLCSPVVRVAVEPKVASDLPKLVEGEPLSS